MLTRYAQGDLTWVDAVAPTVEEVKALMREFELDPALAEDLTSPSAKSKAERYADALYLVLHYPALRALHQRPEQEIDFIIGKKFLITVCYETVDPLHFFARSFEAQTVLGRGSAEHGGNLFASMARSLYRALQSECDALHARLDGVEEHIFAGREREMVAHLSHIGRMLHDFRRTLAPHEEMLQSLGPAGERLFGAGFAYHSRALLGEEARVRHTVAYLRERLSELRDTNDSLLELKQSEIMKKLTMMAFVTFPLSLIAVIFGMSTRSMPIVGLRGDFWIIVGGMGVLTLLFLAYFKRKRWL